MESKQEHLTEASRNSKRVSMMNELIWILKDANELKQKIITVSHGGSAGHGGKKATENIVSKKIIVEGNEARCVWICSQLYTLHNIKYKWKNPSRIGYSIVQAEAQLNKIVQMDFLCVATSSMQSCKVCSTNRGWSEAIRIVTSMYRPKCGNYSEMSISLNSFIQEYVMAIIRPFSSL